MKFSAKIVIALVALRIASPIQAIAAVVYKENGQIGRQLHLPIHEWTSTDTKPKALVLVLHGLGSHGKVYDRLARSLVPLGFIVLAPDMRGFGRWYSSDQRSSTAKTIDFEQSYKDLTAILKAADIEYPTLPRYVIGESLGSVMALRLADHSSNRIEGLVLASPPVAHHHYVCARSLATAAYAIFTPHRQIDMSPYIKKYSSTDVRIRHEILADSQNRNELSPLDLLKASRASRHTLTYAARIPAQVPVLILQGSRDRMLKPRGAYQLMAALPSTDKMLEWYPGMGHVLLETSYVKPFIEKKVDDWLAHRPSVLTAYNGNGINNDAGSVAHHD